MRRDPFHDEQARRRKALVKAACIMTVAVTLLALGATTRSAPPFAIGLLAVVFTWLVFKRDMTD